MTSHSSSHSEKAARLGGQVDPSSGLLLGLVELHTPQNPLRYRKIDPSPWGRRPVMPRPETPAAHRAQRWESTWPGQAGQTAADPTSSACTPSPGRHQQTCRLCRPHRLTFHDHLPLVSIGTGLRRSVVGASASPGRGVFGLLPGRQGPGSARPRGVCPLCAVGRAATYYCTPVLAR